MADGLFAAFCAAGLWPGVTRAIADKLPAAGIQSPDDVSVASLGKVPQLGAKKAERLAKTFAQAAPRYAVAELLHEAGMPLRAAAGIVDALGEQAQHAKDRLPDLAERASPALQSSHLRTRYHRTEPAPPIWGTRSPPNQRWDPRTGPPTGTSCCRGR